MVKRISLIIFLIQILFCCSDNINNNKKIIHGIFSKPYTLDPSLISTKISSVIIPQIFETIVTINNNNVIIPNLAKNWEISLDGLSYSFNLRNDVKFHDDTYLTAEDVKISFLRQFDNNCPYYHYNSPRIFESLFKETINSIDVIDSLTIRFNLKYPNSLFLYIISSPRVSPILSFKCLKTYKERFGEHPVGTGPFKFKNKSEDGSIFLVPFENYWGKIPNIKEIEFKVGFVNDLEIMALNDSIDVLSRISGSNIERFKDSNKFDFFVTYPETIYFLGFNLNKSILKNEEIRKAILLSLDKKKIVNTLNRTNAIIADGPLPNGIYNSEYLMKQKNYNVQKSRVLIKNSKCKDLKLKLIGFEDSPRTRIFFDIIVNYLNQIGIEVDKEYSKDWEYFLKSREYGDFDLTLEGWGADILCDPYFFLYDLFYSKSNFNVFHYKNERVDRLLDEAVRTFDRDKRYKIYEEINNIIIEDIPAVFISQIKDIFVVNKRIKNVKINPYRYIDYKDVIIE